ncbi:polysaccharide deacetylase family protein [Botrimarina sp.]|uniref:polysaccharide deacetylase family protein n=1 Tax=Botrimarina sp. TaxID=2795802 RepID=UPI0032EC8388
MPRSPQANGRAASLSVDLDDKWAYLRSRGDAAWRARPTYLPEVAPRIVDFLGERGLRCTFFVVGEDLTRDPGAREVERIAAAGFEVANHSQSHWPWLDTLPPEEMQREVAEAERLIEQVAGVRPAGFRAPGFSWSPELLKVLARRGYRYDASVFPTFVGPLARAYVRLSGFRKAASDDAPEQRFGSLADALRPLRPHAVATPCGSLVELPVTTMPLARAPIHFTYLSFLAQKSPAAARAYWRTAMRLCRLRRVGPSLLLHPLDFLGGADVPELADFPGMGLARRAKLELLSDTLDRLATGRAVLTTAEHALQGEPRMGTDGHR